MTLLEMYGHQKDIETFDPWDIPLINTLVLLLSGTTVTWSHHALLEDDRKGFIQGLVLTVILGVCFTALQAYEYHHATFAFSDHIYGSVFLYGNRISWFSCDRRYNFLSCMFVERKVRSFQQRSSLWF